MSLQSEDSPSALAHPDLKPEYTPEERTILLDLAHAAIVSALAGRELSPFESTLHLAEPRGVFTSLYHGHRLRGCVGYPLAVTPLYRAVMETARGAAFDDPRFLPVSLDEAAKLQVSLSVLSPLVPITAEEVEVGKHGLLVSHGDRRGLLLPQVPVEHGWDRITFLEQTCRKAGLPLDTWRHRAKIEAFTAEVFGDED
jgi:AmmeMemoRadiSam system protein A